LATKIEYDTLNLYLFFLLALTSSFDIFLNLNFSGFSLRFFYIVEVILIFLLVRNITLRNQTSFMLIGYPYILVWCFLIILFVPNTTILTRSVGYAGWLILSIVLIVLFSTMINKLESFNRLFGLYIFSFTLLALFGLFQFLLGLVGINIYIRQWWIDGVLPRINGFSYEPSYYGSYLIIGWSILLYLYIKNKIFFSQYKYSFLIISVAIILSSSRMAILMMLIGFLYLILVSICRSLYTYKIRKRDFKLFIVFVLIIASVGAFIYNNIETVKFLFSGLGIFATSNHSSEERINEALDTFEVFLNSPFIGYSLGGVSPAIAKLKGVIIYSQIDAKNFEGMNIFLEVLAASGLVGFIFFMLFFIVLYYKAFKTMKQLRNIASMQYTMIGSLSFALFIELFILSMNQNILRPYLWVLIGMFGTSILIGKKIIHEYKFNHRF